MYDPGALYADPILTNFSVGFQDQALFGRQLFPETPVRTKSGRYRVYDRSNWVMYEDRREPGTVANEVLGGKWSEDVFQVQEHSLQSPIFDEERQALSSQGGLAQAVFGGDLQLDPERDATELVTRAIMLRHEYKVSTLIRDPAQYPVSNKTALVGAAQFDDYTGGAASTSNPVQVIRTAINAIYSATKRYPNVMAVPSLGIPIIDNHPRIVDRFKTFSLTDETAFRELTGFTGRIIPVDSVYNAANNIDAAESITSFWGKDIWLGIVDERPGQNTKTFGKTFAWVYPNGAMRPTDRWREEPRKADIVRTSYNYDLKIVSNVAGYLIQNAFSAGAF